MLRRDMPETRRWYPASDMTTLRISRARSRRYVQKGAAMKADAFDRLTKAMAVTSTRRGVLRRGTAARGRGCPPKRAAALPGQQHHLPRRYVPGVRPAGPALLRGGELPGCPDRLPWRYLSAVWAAGPTILLHAHHLRRAG